MRSCVRSLCYGLLFRPAPAPLFHLPVRQPWSDARLVSSRQELCRSAPRQDMELSSPFPSSRAKHTERGALCCAGLAFVQRQEPQLWRHLRRPRDRPDHSTDVPSLPTEYTHFTAVDEQHDRSVTGDQLFGESADPVQRQAVCGWHTIAVYRGQPRTRSSGVHCLSPRTRASVRQGLRRIDWELQSAAVVLGRMDHPRQQRVADSVCVELVGRLCEVIYRVQPLPLSALDPATTPSTGASVASLLDGSNRSLHCYIQAHRTSTDLQDGVACSHRMTSDGRTLEPSYAIPLGRSDRNHPHLRHVNWVNHRCLMQVHPWCSHQPACSLMEIKCGPQHTGNASDFDAAMDTIDTEWLAYLIIRHCPGVFFSPGLHGVDVIA